MRILVVEDERKLREFLKESLEAECFAVDTAEDGETGSWYARSNDYDLIILDNLLPKKGGLTVCREIRLDGKTVPILILSVKNDTVNKVDLLNAGADDYLTKPFALPELFARIRALLRRPHVIEGEILTASDIMLNAKTGTVSRAGKGVYLTRKEFMLLQYLLQNKGSILSRAMILEHVWDMSVDLFSNTIESHILSLRKKLNDMGKVRLIQTQPGRGYRIAE